jgi:uncharacterized membrane protein
VAVDLTLILAVLTGLGAAAVGGVYLAFSVLVMPAFRRVGADAATAAMLEINRWAERGPFIVVFLGAALAAIALGMTALIGLPDPVAGLRLAAAVLSLGSTVITVAANVPHNNRLVRDGAGYWPVFQKRWGRLNTLRGILALAAVALLVLPGTSSAG